MSLSLIQCHSKHESNPYRYVLTFMPKIILRDFLNENVKNAHFAFLRKVNSDVKFVSQNECLCDRQLTELAMYKCHAIPRMHSNTFIRELPKCTLSLILQTYFPTHFSFNLIVFCVTQPVILPYEVNCQKMLHPAQIIYDVL